MSTSSGAGDCKIITARADPDAGGTVAFGAENTSVTVTATANSGYAFVNWTENGSEVTGTDGNPVGATYSFTVTDDRDLVANFVQIVASGTCGENVYWTLDGNGTLTISGTGPMYDYSESDHSPWYNKSSSIKAVKIEDGVTSAGNRMCIDCKNLSSVTIADTVTKIEDNAFRRCTALQSIVLPANTETIGAYAFSGCSNLASVTIPASVTSIGNYAFYGCSRLQTINFTGIESQWNGISKGNGWKDDVPATVVHCSDGDVAL
jgi:hypothetical protein